MITPLRPPPSQDGLPKVREIAVGVLRNLALGGDEARML